jgi:hypothetical protein
MHILGSIREKQGTKFGASSEPQQSFPLLTTAKIPALDKDNRYRNLLTWMNDDRSGCVTRIAGPNGDTQLHER